VRATLVRSTLLLVLWLSIPYSRGQNGQKTQHSGDEGKPSIDNRCKSVVGFEIVSDTMGVDFGPYLNDVVQKVRENWYKLVPDVARGPMLKEGYVGIDFAIRKDGSVDEQKLWYGSGDVQLDRAAWAAISDLKFPALPPEFKGEHIKLRFPFVYNSKFQISPHGPVTLVAGSIQQFSVPATGSANPQVTWTLLGKVCATSECGTVAETGLYSAPGKVSKPLSLTLRAEQKSAPYQVACALVTVIPERK
jgi:TonB family protein